MGSEDVDSCMDKIATRAMERLDDLILVMERAADQVTSGGPRAGHRVHLGHRGLL